MTKEDFLDLWKKVQSEWKKAKDYRTLYCDLIHGHKDKNIPISQMTAKTLSVLGDLISAHEDEAQVYLHQTLAYQW